MGGGDEYLADRAVILAVSLVRPRGKFAMTRPARRWLLAVVATLATTVLAVVDGAAAIAQEGPSGPADVGIAVAPNPAVGNVSAKMLKAMQRDLKVTAEQAKARLVQADWASRLDPPLRQRLVKTYAGSWLAKDGQEFVVAITDRSKEAMVRASGATPRLVARSEAELSAIGARLDTHATKTKRVPERVAGWVVDPQTNQVRVEVLPGGRADAAAFVSAAGPRQSR